MRRGKKFNRVKNKPYVDHLKSISGQLVGLHFKLERLTFILGYTKEKDDTWQAMSPDELRRHQKEWQRLSEIFTPIRSEYNLKHYSKTFHREYEIEGEINMSKMGFRDMMDWATEHSKFEARTPYIKFPEGVHLGRVIPFGNNSEYDAGLERFFRSYTQHDMGQKQTFWPGLCQDYVMDNKKGIRKYLIEKNKLTKPEGEKIKTYGCVGCTTLETLDKEFGYDRKELNGILRTKTRVIMNMMYIRQAMPEPVDKRTGKVLENVPKTGIYLWDMSPAGFKKILQSLERFVKLEAGLDDDEEIDEDTLMEFFSLEGGLNLAIGAEGEGVGKNSREYTFEFKGTPGRLEYREMPYGKEKSEKIIYDPEVLPAHSLVAAEADKFLTYQQMANKMLFLPGDNKPTELAKIIRHCGYEIPGFELSDNPLDENYSQGFADKVLQTAKKKTLGLNPVKNVHAEKARERQRAKEEEENKPWDEEEEDTPPTKKNKAKVTGKTLAHEEDDEEEEEEVETPVSKAKKKLREQETSKSKSVDKRMDKSNKKSKKVEEDEDEDEDFEATDDDVPWTDEVNENAEEDEDEEDEEEDEEEEDEEVKTPIAKAKEKLAAEMRAKKAKEKFEKAVPPDDDEEDEEEEERPKKKTGQKRRLY